MGRIINLIDRSRVEAREECPMLRFLGYDFDGTGLDSSAAALPLLSGIAIHAAHARLLAGQPLEEVVTTVIGDYVAEIKARGLFGLTVTTDVIREQSALLEGMLRAWVVVRMPRILEEYEVVSIEQTWDWELVPGLVQRLRMDVILRRRDDGLLFILDYKTVAYPSDAWMEKFEHSLQTCLYLQALKERMNEPVGGILYEGLVKGLHRVDTAHSSPWYGQRIQQGPYTIAYALKGEAGLAIYQSAYTSKKGYQKVRTFDEMPMREWVEGYLLPSDQVNDLFVIVPPICPPAHELLEVKDQVVWEELQYHELLGRYRDLLEEERTKGLDSTLSDNLLRRLAPKRTGRCWKYGVDNRCKFLSTVCFNQGAQPLAEDGGFIRRVPHHDTDLEMVA